MTKSSLTDAASTSMFFAARSSFPGSAIQIVHLAEDEPTPIEIETKKLNARRGAVDEVISAIVAGDLPPDRNSRTCPRCPAFFICGPLPEGTLVKKV